MIQESFGTCYFIFVTQKQIFERKKKTQKSFTISLSWFLRVQCSAAYAPSEGSIHPTVLHSWLATTDLSSQTREVQYSFCWWLECKTVKILPILAGAKIFHTETLVFPASLPWDYSNHSPQEWKFPGTFVLGQVKSQSWFQAEEELFFQEQISQFWQLVRPHCKRDWSWDSDGSVMGGTHPDKDCAVKHTSCLLFRTDLGDHQCTRLFI